MSDPIVSFVTTTSNKLGCAESVPVVPGQLIVTTDTEAMYFDKPGATDISQRIAITDVIVCDTYEDRPIAPLDKFYLFRDDPNSLYYYFEGKWREVKATSVLPGLTYVTCIDSEGNECQKLSIDYNHSLCIDGDLKLGVSLSGTTGNTLSLVNDGIFGRPTIVEAGGGGIKVDAESDRNCTKYTVSFNQSSLLANIQTETPITAKCVTEGVKTISLNYDTQYGLMKLSEYAEKAITPACNDKLMLHASDDDFLFEVCKDRIRTGLGQLMLKYQPCDSKSGSYGYLAKVDNANPVKPGTLGLQLAKTLDDNKLEGTSDHPIYEVITEAKQLLSGYVRDTATDIEDEDAEYRQSGLVAFVNADTGLLVHDFIPADAGSTTGEDGSEERICSKIVSLSLLQDSSGVRGKCVDGWFDQLKPALAVGYQTNRGGAAIPGVGVLVAKSGINEYDREFTNMLGFEGGNGLDIDCSGLHVIAENGCSGLAYNSDPNDTTVPYGMYVNISSCVDNILERRNDGMYVNANNASGCSITYTGEEPITISTDNVIGLCYNASHMSVCSGKLQVNISSCVDNSLEVKNDGLYVPASCSSGGLQNLATGTGSLTILGDSACCSYTVNIGVCSNATYSYATALGAYSYVDGGATAIGYSARASSGATSMGYCSCASINATAIGNCSSAGMYATVIGYGSCAYCSGVAIGYDSCTASEGVAIGRSSVVNNTNGVAIGTYSSTQCNSVAIGLRAQVCGVNAIAIGYEAQNSVDQSILLSTEKYGVHFRCDCAGLGPGIEYRVGAICQDEVYGYMPFARSSGSSYTATAPILIDTSANDISLCYNPCSLELCSSELRVRVSSTSGNALSVLGDGLYVCSSGGSSGLQNTATGNNALTVLGVSSSYNCSINIGYNSKVTGVYSTTLGVCSCAASYGTAMGYRSCSAQYGVSVGYSSCSSSTGVAIGTNSCSYASGVAIGYSSTTLDVSGVAIGATTAADCGSVAIGSGLYATEGSVIIGSGNCGTGNNTVTIGINSITNGRCSIAIGGAATATSGGIAIGSNTTSIGGCGPGGITIGNDSTGGTGIAIGHGSSADCGAFGFVAIGDCASSSGNHNVAIGLCSTAYNSSVAIGPFSGCSSQPGSIHIKAGSCSTRYKDSSGDNIRLQTDSLDMYFHGDYIEGCNPGFFYKTRYGTSGHIAFDDMGSGGGGGGGPYLPISGGTVTDNFSVLPLGCTTALGAPAYGLHVSSSGGLQLFGTHFLQGTLWSNDGLKIVSNNLSLTTLDEAYISSDYANTTTFRAMPNDGAQATYKFEAWGWTDSSHTSKSPSLGVRLLKPSQKTPLEATSVLNMEEGDARWGGSSTLKLCSKMLYFDTSGYLCVRLSSNPMNELEFLDDGLYHCGLPY